MTDQQDAYTVAVISDTHGLVRPEALEAMRGADLIVHAGDIGGKEVVRAFETIAPVRLVRGNTDVEPWSRTLGETDAIDVDPVWLFVLHDLGTLGLDPAAGGFDVVISGHSHKPHRYEKRGVLYFNRGSAGPRRFRLPISVGRLRIVGKSVSAEHITLPG